MTSWLRDVKTAINVRSSPDGRKTQRIEQQKLLIVLNLWALSFGAPVRLTLLTKSPEMVVFRNRI